MRRILGVEVVILTAPAPILPVGRGDFEHRDPGLLQEAQEPGAIAAGRLNPDALDFAERAHPGELDFPPWSGGVRSERHAAARMVIPSMLARASAGVR